MESHHNLLQIQAAVDAVNCINYMHSMLVAVTKMKSTDHILSLLRSGHRVFGENHIRETSSKWLNLRRDYSDTCLHLIGPLQANKVREAVALFDIIETLDRLELASALTHEMLKTARNLYCLVQVNIGKEEKKAGIYLSEVDSLIRVCRYKLRLLVKGLMCIPPVYDNPMFYFSCLHEIAYRNGLPMLSMGMSNDFLLAIQFGATHIRVGTAIFSTSL